jgi:hypothetical protein
MLGNRANRSFALLEASWPAGKARQMLEALQPSHAIVRGAADAGEDEFYLFRAPEVSALLAAGGEADSAFLLLDLESHRATPILDADDDELAEEVQSLEQAVVLDHGRVIGFVDDQPQSAQPSPPFAAERGFGDLAIGRTRGSAPSTGGGLEAYSAFESFAAVVEPAARSLVADFPTRVVAGETHTLLVYLSVDVSAGQLPIVAPVGETLEIVVKPLRGFELAEGKREGQIAVSGSGDSDGLQFKLRATEVGLGTIRLFVFAAQRSLGQMTLEVQVAETADELVGSGGATKREKLLPMIAGPAPDLSLIVTEERIDGKPCLTFSLRTREPLDPVQVKQEFGPVELELDPQEHFREFFKDIQNLTLEPDWERRLAEQGRNLYRSLVPEDLRALLWSHHERIRSVQIQSEEPWIPWELCKLHGRENGRMLDGPYFCEVFAMTRWLPDLASKLELPLRKIALVVPAGSGLANAEVEREFILTLAGTERSVDLIPGTLADVVGALKSGQYDGWHFVCHGSAHETNPDRAELELEAGDALRPESLSGEVENLGNAAPLVFLNACQSSQAARAITGVGGWAERFLRANAGEDFPTHGAAALIGAYWKIDDKAAFPFAKAFYAALLDAKNPKTIGEAIREARLAVRSPGDATWLAYTAFAHPLATVG